MERLSGFRALGLAVILFCLPNLAVFVATSICPDLTRALWLSADQPWGIFTAVFIHADLTHLMANLIAFLFVSIIFIESNYSQDKETRQFRSKVFLLLIFPSGFAANVIDFFLRWQPSGITDSGTLGASGICYVAFGICLASAVTNFAGSLGECIKIRRERYKADRLKQELPALLINLLIAAISVGYIVFVPESFLSVAPGINVFAHSAGFLIGFMLSLVLFVIYSIRKTQSGVKL